MSGKHRIGLHLSWLILFWWLTAVSPTQATFVPTLANQTIPSDQRQLHLPFLGAPLLPACTVIVRACKLTNDAANHRSSFPAWSPDGRRITFVKVHFDANSIKYELYLMNADGSQQVKLADDGIQPNWSPNDGKIVFGNNASGEIYVIDVDSRQLMNLTNSASFEQTPVWSPDGSKIMYMIRSLSSCCPTFDLYVMDANGTNQVKVASNINIAAAPTWSPDSSKIVFGTSRNYNGTVPIPTPSDIYVVDANGTNQKMLASVDSDNQYISIATWATWSPDSKKLVFAIASTDNGKIYMADVDGSEPKKVIAQETGPIWQPALSPDGTKIVFTVMLGIRVVDVDGRNEINLTSSPNTVNDGLLWSPDSQRLTYVDTYPSSFALDADRTLGGGVPPPPEIYVIHADGGQAIRLSYTPISQGGGIWQSVWSPDSSKITFVRASGIVGYGPPANYLAGFGIGNIYVVGVEDQKFDIHRLVP